MQDFIKRAREDRVFFARFRAEIASTIRTIETVELSIGPIETQVAGQVSGGISDTSAAVELQREVGADICRLVEAALRFKKFIGIA